jgi:hypothetical protein
MFHTINLAYLVASAIIYFAILSALFRLRSHVGIGAFFCALGVMHFLSPASRYEDLLAEQTKRGGSPPNSSPRPRRTTS